MKTKLILILLFCGLIFLQAQNPRKIEIKIDGYNREYLLYLPANYNPAKKSGLIVCLHGFNRTMEDFFNNYPIEPVADQLNMVVLAPQALPEQDQNVIKESKNLESYGIKIPLEGAWGCGLRVKAAFLGISLLNEELNRNVDDVAFIKQIVTATKNQYSINDENCFLFGTSMGGFMSYQYAMYHGNDLAGLISICGSMGTSIRNTTANVNVPVCDFHSKTDEVVPYGGELSYALGFVTVELCQTKDNVINFWVNNKNKANPRPQEENINYYASTNNIKVKKYTYSPLETRSEVIHYQIDGASHDYYLSKDKGDCMDYNEEVIKFIQSHLKFPAGVESVIVQEVVVSPNPTSGILKVTGTKANQTIQVFDITGSLKGAFKTQEGATTIDLSNYIKGIYLLRHDGKAHKVIKK